MKAIFLPILLFACVFALPASAQFSGSLLEQSPALLAVTPEFPAPGDMATISIENFGAQLLGSEITWTIDGEVMADMSNMRSVEVVTGSLGNIDEISATVRTQAGSVQELTTTIEPKFVDIIIEPQTRVPDFYEGRAQPSIGSQVNATVLVNDGDILVGDFLYTWRVNGKVLEGGPIRGINTVSFDTPRGSQATIEVTVAELTGEIIASGAVYFESVRPELHFYESNALYGQSHTTVGESLFLAGQASTIIAEPYYLDIRYFNDPDILEWKIDNTIQSENVINPYQITLQKISDTGNSKVTFHVRSTTQLLQGIEDSFNLIF